MGSLLNATCHACGFETEPFQFGAGMRDFTTRCAMPALDTATSEFIVVNMLSPSGVPAGVKPYADPDMYKAPDTGPNDFHEWQPYQLSEHGNRCPQCGKFTMDFLWAGDFD